MTLNSTKRALFIFIGIFSLSIILFISCDEGGITNEEYQIQHQKKAQLANTYTNGIIPLNKAFVLATESLKSKIVAFKQDTTIENLEIAQAQWIEMLKIWKQLELYNVGTIENTFIHFEINRWPTHVENINSLIAGTETIDEVFIAAKGSSSKGISALEYLLFSSENNQEILYSFTTAINKGRRLDYLVALSKNLGTKAKDLEALWVAYESEFISSLENGISGSQNQLTNAMITLVEEIVISKLGNALGNSNGGIINKEALEAYRSRTSLIIIQEHLNALYRCYKGNFKEETIKLGYDDYLVLIGNERLDVKIVNAFNICQEKIDAIENSLYNELTRNPQNVIDLQNAFTDLLVIIKVDMANTIGTTITINDNDGD